MSQSYIEQRVLNSIQRRRTLNNGHPFYIGIISALNLKLGNVKENTSYSHDEEDDSGIHTAHYNVSSESLKSVDMTKTWSESDYSKYADGRPGSKIKHSNSFHKSTIKIYDGVVQNVRRTHTLYFNEILFDDYHSSKSSAFQSEYNIKTYGESHLQLIQCTYPNNKRRRERSLQSEDVSWLNKFNKDTLMFRELHLVRRYDDEEEINLKTVYELLRCHWDPAVTKSELNECIKELHIQSKKHNSTFQSIVALAESLSHQNLTTWSALVGCLVIKNDELTQRVLANLITTAYPRSLTDTEFEYILEAVFFLPSGPLSPRLIESLLSVYENKNGSKNTEVSHMAMLVVSALVKKCYEAGHNNSLPDFIIGRLLNSFMNHPHRHHDNESETYQSYLRNHLLAFGNLGHISSLNFVTSQLNDDNSVIRLSAVRALRKLPSNETDHLLLDVLKRDEHVSVKTAVIKVLTERGGDISAEFRNGIVDALWETEEKDEFDMAISQFLKNNNGNTNEAIRFLRKERAKLRRKKRALLPILKPREFSLGPKKEWSKVFGGEHSVVKLLVKFINQIKLRIGIFGGKFELDLDNAAEFTGKVLSKEFNIIDGKAAFKMAASFKNDIPKDLIHNIVDVVDSFLSKVDALSTIFIQHIQNFINRLKGYLPLRVEDFLTFLVRGTDFVQHAFQPIRFGKHFNTIVHYLHNFFTKSGILNKILFSVKSIFQKLTNVQFSTEPFSKAKNFLEFLTNTIDLVSTDLPHGLPTEFNIKDFLNYILRNSAPLTKGIANYFATISASVPTNLYKVLHFKTALHFPRVIKNFNELALRFLKFGNSYLGIDDIFSSLSTIRIPQQLFDTSFSLEEQTDFNDDLFLNLSSIISTFAKIFDKFENQPFDFEKFFNRYLIDIRKTVEHLKFFPSQTNPHDSISQWFRSSINEFKKALMRPNDYLIQHSQQSGFFEEEIKHVETLKKTSLKNICNLQSFIQRSSEDLQDFGKKIESGTLTVINNIEKETLTVIDEISNATHFVEMFIDNFKLNVSKMAEKFVSKSVDKVDKLLEDVQDVAGEISLFISNTTNKYSGFCYNSANISGKILDYFQEGVQNAVAELTSFVFSSSEPIRNITATFKQVVKKVIKWHGKYLEKHFGKFNRISQTIDEVLSLLKNETDFWKSAHDVWEVIDGVVKHLENLPEYAQAAISAADRVTLFASRANTWRGELEKLNWRRSFGIEFDDRFRTLCNQFQSFGIDLAKQVEGKSLLNKLKQFVSDKTDLLISNVVTKIETLKKPLRYAQNHLEEFSESVSGVSAMLKAVRPFSEKISPILNEVDQLPNCFKLDNIFSGMITKCTKSSKAFGKTTYNEYKKLLSNLEGFITFIPDDWKDLYLDKCVHKGTCLSQVFIKQALEISKSLKRIGNKFQIELFLNLNQCRESFKPVISAAESIKTIITKVKEFNLNDEIKKIKYICERITGRIRKFEERSHVRKRSSDFYERDFENLAEYMRRANNTERTINNIIEDVFRKLKDVFDEEVVTFHHELDKAKQNLQMGVKTSEKAKVIIPNLQALENVTEDMNDFTRHADVIVGSFKGTIFELLSKISGFSDVFSKQLKGYGKKILPVVQKVNGLLDKVYSFLNTIQLRQKGLDIRDYKRWSEYPYCSEDVCVRPLHRSSNLYRKRIFPWKYPHLDDLSSLKNTGKWLTPGLFDDYKVRGIAQWSETKILLGMQGVASNQGKPSLLVIVDISSDISAVSKIFQVSENESPFTGEMGGIAIIKQSYVWFSNKDSLFAVQYVDIKDSMETPAPSTINVRKRKNLAHTVHSISFDRYNQVIWAVDREKSKAYSYQCSITGDIGKQVKTFDTGSHTCSLTIVRQFGIDYASVAKCTLEAGYQCKLEFHSLDTETLDTSSLHRVVRTPSGLESVQTVNSETVMLAFSSGTFNDKDRIERVGGDFEDQFFKIKLPILTTNLSITENCLFLKIGSYDIIPARRLLPFGKLKCGTQRKWDMDWSGLFDIDIDVYTDDLEMKRGISVPTVPESVCDWNYDTVAKSGSHDIVPEKEASLSVMGLSVGLFFGVKGHYTINCRVSLCLHDKRAKLSLIPGAWISVYGGVKVSFFIAAIGATLEGKILETYLVPEIAVRIDKWPLEACITLKIESSPFTVSISIWIKFGLCGTIKFLWISFDFSLGVCARKTIFEWSWSATKMRKTLFTNCKKDVDQTPPENGECTAKQVGDKSYLVEWRGFTENTKIQNYTIIVGSIVGSGDDFYKVVGLRQSLVIENLEIMDGRSVYAAVYAANSAGLKGLVVGCPEFLAKRKPPTVIFIYDGESLKDINYQPDPTTIAMNYKIEGNFSEIASIQWGVSSSAHCTLKPNEADVLSLTSIGESFSVKKHGINLKNGATYHARVVVINHLGLSTVACSDGVMIDTTPPVPQSFTVGRQGLVPSLNRVRGKFKDFLDEESPITKYEWKLIDQTTYTDITDFIEIRLTQRKPFFHGLNLTGGRKYTAILRGTNAAGLSSVAKFSDIIPDESPPICDGPIIDVIHKYDSDDIDFVGQTVNLTARFACYDDESGINLTEAAVGTYPGGDNILNFTDIQYLLVDAINDSKTKTVTLTNITLSSLTRYYITIRIKNNIGLFKTLWTDGILIDTSKPTVLPIYIRDGPGGLDAKFSKDSIVFSAHWENAFADAESGMAVYFVGLGTSPGQDDVTRFRSYGLKTQALISSSGLRSGITYYVTVIGCNPVNMCVNASSNGALVDFIAPNAGLVHAGTGSPATEITWINTGAWAHWKWCLTDKNKSNVTSDMCDSSSFYDIHSGIKHFGLTVFSYEFADELQPVRTVGRVEVSGIDVNMPNGFFSVVVEAMDHVGLVSSSKSRSFVVDATPPSIVDIYHGNEHQRIKYIKTIIYAVQAFFEIVEDVSYIVSYSLGVGSYAGGNDIKPFVQYKNTYAFLSKRLRINWTDLENITLVHDMKYYITVKATNAAGLISVHSSNSLICDTKEPKILDLFDGWESQDNDLHRFSNIYRMHWRQLPDISGIKETKVCLTTSLMNNATCDIHQMVTIPNTETSFSFGNLKLYSGVYVYAMLQLTDNAGNLASYWSDGALVDTSSPILGRVMNNRPGENRQWQREINILYASWSGFSDPESSIHHYELAFGTQPRTSDIQAFTNVGLATSAASSNLGVTELKNGVIYFASVIAYNNVGIVSDIASSNGIFIDSEPPVFTQTPYDGTISGVDNDYSRDSTTLSVNWKCVDEGSGLNQVLIGFGTQPGLQDVAQLNAVLPIQTFYKISNFKLDPGHRYFSIVKCINNIGLQTSALSDGIVFDSTPPIIAFLSNGRTAYRHVHYVDGVSPIFANWRTFDAESHVALISVEIKHRKSGKLAADPMYVDITDTSLDIPIQGELKQGEEYFVTLIVTNGAGLSAHAESDSFVADNTAPECNNVYVVDSHGLATEFIHSETNIAVHFECNDPESGISKYSFAIEDLALSKFISPFHEIKGVTVLSSDAVVGGLGKKTLKIINGGVYRIIVRAKNGAKLTKEYPSPKVKVDLTSPVLKNVTANFYVSSELLKVVWEMSDRESGIKSIFWALKKLSYHGTPANFTEISKDLTELVISTSNLLEGVIYSVQLKAINMAGMSVSVMSNGVVLDRTPPTLGIVTATLILPLNYDGNVDVIHNVTFSTKWNSFKDKESAIISYKWAIGLSTSNMKLLSDGFYAPIPFGHNNGYLIKNQTVSPDTAYHVCIRVANGLALEQTSCSEEILVKVGKLSVGVVSDGPYTDDIDFQLDDKAIWLHWDDFQDPVYGLREYKWCYGLVESNNTNNMTCASPMINVYPLLTTSAHQFHNVSLMHGQHYIVKVAAFNNQGQSVIAISDGFTVDRTAPLAEFLSIAGNRVDNVVYISTPHPPEIVWFMNELESVIDQVTLSVGSFPFHDDLLRSIVLDRNQRSVDINTFNFTLKNGMSFFITIVGKNIVGLKRQIVSPQIIVDFTAPNPGEVTDGNGAVDADYQRDNTRFFASWSGFCDHESGVVDLMYCVGTKQGKIFNSGVTLYQGAPGSKFSKAP